jgi:hypothetical protein
MTTDLSPRLIDRFCNVLQSALREEDHDDSQIDPDNGRVDHLLLSVASSLSAFAPEVAIAYLVRKEVRCQGSAVEWNPCKDRNFVDLCLVVNDGYATSFEITGPWGIWDSNNMSKTNAQRVNRSIPDVPTAERYSGWSLSLRDDKSTRALEQFVRSALQSFSKVIVYVVANPIPVLTKRTAKAISRYDGHGYECLRVIVFSGAGAWCDGCRQEVANSKLFSIGGGSIHVCRACHSEAVAMVRQ